MIWLALISIAALTAAVKLLDRFMSFKICAVCAGTSLTWLWMLGAHWLGYDIDMKIIALLIGGSVVGITYEAKKRAPDTKLPLVRKTALILTGFAAAYSLIEAEWPLFLAASILMALLIFKGFKKTKNHHSSEKVEELKKQMEECC